MNSVRAVRRLMPAGPRLPGDVERGALIAVAALCAVLFVVFFLLARAVSPASHATAGSSPGVVAARVGDEVPLRLSTAPAILTGVRAVLRPAPVARAGTAARRATAAPP